MKSVLRSWWVLASAVLVAHPAAAEPKADNGASGDVQDGDPDHRSPRIYLRPYMGWGWSNLTGPEDRLNWYRLGLGVAGGVNLSGLSLGLDFNYFKGTPGDITLVDPADDPVLTGEGRANAFRLAADVGYDLGWKWIAVRPHLLGGVDWHRLTVGEDHSFTKRSAFWAPCLMGLIHIGQDGLAAIGPDARWNMYLDEGTVYTHFSGLIAFEGKF